MAFLADTSGRREASSCPLDRSARAAITALARALEVFDRPAARRAALRAHLADRIAIAADISLKDRVDAITGSILSEIGILLTHARPVGTVDIVPDPASAVLSATLLDRLPGLEGTSDAVRHQFERWDGSGGPHGARGPEIPIAARLLALSATLVGHPNPGQPPNWTARQRRVDDLLGTALDPDLGAAAADELESGDSLPSTVELGEVLAGLDRFVAPERNAPVEALVSIGEVVRAADRVDEVLLVIAEQAKRSLGATVVSICRFDHERPESQRVQTMVNAGAGLERFPAEEFHNDDARPGLSSLLTGQGFVRTIFDGRADDRGIVSLHRRGLGSEAAWPIIIGDSIWGIVWATTRDDEAVLDHDHLSTLRLVATHAAAAISQAQRIAEFEELALSDPLTGLGNRRVLEEKLDSIFQRSPIDRQDVALIMCDVDGLKQINDTEGHAAGDRLLVEAGEALLDAASTVSKSTVCRIGGDEFCIILDGGGMLSAEPVMTLAARTFAESGTGRSLSCGIAFATPDVASPIDLLGVADEAQYEAKRRRKGLPPVAELPALGSRRRAHREH
jgi:diguanylate cyclase (GGDEF)-like protein